MYNHKPRSGPGKRPSNRCRITARKHERDLDPIKRQMPMIARRGTMCAVFLRSRIACSYSYIPYVRIFPQVTFSPILDIFLRLPSGGDIRYERSNSSITNSLHRCTLIKWYTPGYTIEFTGGLSLIYYPGTWERYGPGDMEVYIVYSLYIYLSLAGLRLIKCGPLRA